MNPVARLFFLGSAILFALGLAWQFGGKFLNFGRLPGDIAIERGGFRFYFPIVTCILLSVILSALAYLIRRLSK